jgi:rhodanese-related sulfurtransferase
MGVAVGAHPHQDPGSTREGGRVSLKRVSPEEAQRMMEDEGYVYLDVRSIPEFEAGHPKGAYNVPLLHMAAGGMQPNDRFMDEVRATFAKDAKIVVGCKAGGRSLQAAELMAREGFSDVIDQRAGFDGARDAFGRVAEPGWAHVSLPTATTPEAGRSYAELAAKVKK